MNAETLTLTVERAYAGDGSLIGWRLSSKGSTFLVWNDPKFSGFRVGDAFVPGVDETIRYEVVALIVAAAKAPATYASERAALITEVGECCQGCDPLCAGGCLVASALRKRAAARAPADPAVRRGGWKCECGRWNMESWPRCGDRGCNAERPAPADPPPAAADARADRMEKALRQLREAGNADPDVEKWMREIIDAAIA